MNKYFTKLNGDTEKLTIDIIQINKLPIIAEGSTGIIRLFNIKYIIKQFNIYTDNIDNLDNYNNEKNIYINKLSLQYGTLQLNQLNYKHNKKNIKFNNLNYDNKNYKILIFGDILDYIKTIGPPILLDCFRIFIQIINSSNEMNIFAEYLDDTTIRIGKCIFNYNLNEYQINIDSIKTMKLQFYDDFNKLLVYKYYGDSLQTVFKNQKEPLIIHRILLCFDLIQQINDLINRGIYHNDLKNNNIVIKKVGNNLFLTIIDYGNCKTKIDIENNYNNKTYEMIYSTANTYSPEYYIINNLILSNISLYDYTILFDKMQYWILGGICINILLWQDKQFNVWKTHYNQYDYYKAFLLYNIEKHKNKNELYINELILSIDKIKCDLPIYKELINIIINLLEIQPHHKYLISELYSNISSYPIEYQEYYKLKNKIDEL